MSTDTEPASEKTIAAQLDARREAVAALLNRWPTPAGVEIAQRDIGGLRAYRYAAADSAEDPVIVHIHGGGFTAGAGDLYGAMLGRIVLDTGLTALSLDYRLAPEHPFPAALEDVRAFLREISRTGHIAAVVADSAGGALAVAALADATVTASSLVLFSPLLDLTGDAESYRSNAASDRMFSAHALESVRELYLAGHDPRDPTASPLHASHPALPPALVFASESEVLRDDAIGFSEAARLQGRHVQLRLAPGLDHVWQIAGDGTAPAQQSLAGAAEFILRHARIA